MKNYILPCIVAIGLFSCSQKKQNGAGGNEDYKKITGNPIVFCQTVKSLNEVVLHGNFPPMIGSRNYAYALIAAYECMVAGDNQYVSLSGQIKHLPAMPLPQKKEGIDFNLASLYAFIKAGNEVTFPEGNMMKVYDRLKDSLEKTGIPSGVLEASVAYGGEVAKTVLGWAKKDRYLELRTAEKIQCNTGRRPVDTYPTRIRTGSGTPLA